MPQQITIPVQRVNGGDAQSRRVALSTLGCKVNSYESELIGELLQTRNWQVVPSHEQADLYLINTCTVTAEADRQARQQIRRAVKRNPNALVVVTGCYAQMDAQACADIPGVDLVLGNDRKLDIHNLLPELQNGILPRVLVGNVDEHVSLPDQLLTGYSSRTRAFVQVQQGCDQSCTFCIIHRARGPSLSFLPALVERQIERLAINAYPEVVICGVDLGAYGDDLDADFDLVDLLHKIIPLSSDENPFRIRLSSIDPAHITDRLIALMASEPRMCPHLHLSLQSGSDLILKRMKRRYTSSQVKETIRKCRQSVPELVLSADVMVGFPTETEEDYLQTERLVAQMQIAFPHVFSYSERQGTPAARIPHARQVSPQIKKQRSQRLRSLASILQKTLYQQRLGTSAWVVPEKALAEGTLLARAEDYVTAIVQADTLPPGQWKQVRYTSIEDGKLYAMPVNKCESG